MTSHQDKSVLLEKLFADDSLKDVTFELANGDVERAHRNVLVASSDVFRQMFTHDVSERTGTVRLPDVDKQSMRVFLRLLYTGQVDPEDWGAQATAQTTEFNVASSCGFKVKGRRLIARKTDAVAILAQKSCRVQLPNLHWYIGIVLAGTAASENALDNNTSYTVAFDDDKMPKLFYPGLPSDTDVVASNWRPLKLGQVVSWKVRNVGNVAKLSVAYDDEQFVDLEFPNPIPAADYHLILAGPVSDPDEVDDEDGLVPSTAEIVDAAQQCPVDVLTSVGCLADKYMVTEVSYQVVSVMKKRFKKFRAASEVQAYQELFLAALQTGIGGAKLAALDAARDFPALRTAFEAESLDASVMHELGSLWPRRSAKRRRSEFS